MSFTDPVASIFSPGFRKERHYVGIFSPRLALSVGSLFCHFQKFTNYISWVCKHRNGELPFADLSKNVFERAVYVMYEYIFNPHIHRLPVGLIAQLVKHGTGVAKVRVQVLIKPNVYRRYLLLLSVDNCKDYILKIYYYLILTN